MARRAGDRGAVLCLGLICIALVLVSGCNYARYATGDMTAVDCERVSGLDRDHCYKRLAVDTKNSTICQKIEDPGPKSKCYLELKECSRLSFQATGDGAYTKYDCYQYQAIQERSVKLCEKNLADYASQNRNDLNPTGVSKEICIQRVTEKCGHIGQNQCHDSHFGIDYCVEGDYTIGGKCAAAGA